MNKLELVNKVAESANISKSSAADAVNATFDSIREALADGDSVSIIGFGTFSVGRREARTGRNPSTGSTIQIPASNVPKFKAGKGLKDAVN